MIVIGHAHDLSVRLETQWQWLLHGHFMVALWVLPVAYTIITDHTRFLLTLQTIQKEI